MKNFSFAEPWWFLLLFLLLPMIYSYRSNKITLKYPSVLLFMSLKKSSWLILKDSLFILRCLVIVLFTLALARPQSGRSDIKQKTEGLDIMMVVDTSGSMQALDFTFEGKRQNRLYVVKKVLGEFIQKRSDDRLGMIVFGTQAYAQAPLTLDHDVLLQYIKFMEIGMAGDSTSIGDAVGVALNRLKDLKSKSKVIILLTDGANTSGKINPLEVTNVAKTLGVKIYTIGVGSDGLVPFPTNFGYQKVKVEIDEKLLKQMASETGAKYFRAKDTQALQAVYDTIDRLEKSEVEVKVFRNYEEKYALFLWPGFFFLFLELLLGLTRFRRIP